MKIRIKYLITISVMIIGTVMNFLKIDIQDSWVKLMLGCLIIILAGFSIKKIKEVIELWKK